MKYTSQTVHMYVQAGHTSGHLWVQVVLMLPHSMCARHTIITASRWTNYDIHAQTYLYNII